MNRLLLIGNGFDLAHNLKTSYNDFILWYLKKAYRTTHSEGHYRDNLLEITHIHTHHDLNFGNIHGLDALIDHFYQHKFSVLLNSNKFQLPGYANYWINPFLTKIKSTLIKTLLTNCSITNWVDIENEYYRELKTILATKHQDRKTQDLDELNQTLTALIEELHQYLSELPEPKFDQRYRDILISEANHADPMTSFLKRQLPQHTMVLNFNYTSTIVQYLNKLGISTELNYIHGKLGDQEHPLIFGFGDEIDTAYQQMEDEQDNRFFTYIKSFWYFLNSNYRDLSRFIGSDEYEVYILGHSCGLSDRTMLNMLFEHENCKSIKIYYYENQQGQTNFTQLTQEISRHFKDKKAMRNKIVDIKNCAPMPQVE